MKSIPLHSDGIGCALCPPKRRGLTDIILGLFRPCICKIEHRCPSGFHFHCPRHHKKIS